MITTRYLLEMVNMSTLNGDLVRDVLSLPVDQRAALIERLIESLNLPTSPEIDAMWMEEVERRAEEVDNGTAELIDGEKVFDDIRRRFQQ
jgi:putative addiction module component (TIGR02574 family)